MIVVFPDHTHFLLLLFVNAVCCLHVLVPVIYTQYEIYRFHISIKALDFFMKFTDIHISIKELDFLATFEY